MDITFTISDEKVQRVIDAVKGVFPIPTNSTGVPLYTPGAWAKERIRRMIINIVHTYETKIAVDQIIKDDTLVT